MAGASLGARVVQELALSRPHLLSHAVRMAAHERPPPVQSLLSAGERALHDAGIELPSGYYVVSLMIGFADDLMLPPQLAREVAEAIPSARYEDIDGCGHYGYLERPAEVNELIVKFFASH